MIRVFGFGLVWVFFFFFFGGGGFAVVFSTSLISYRKFGSLDFGKATAAPSTALPIPNSACGVFVCPNKATAANAWDL